MATAGFAASAEAVDSGLGTSSVNSAESYLDQKSDSGTTVVVVAGQHRD